MLKKYWLKNFKSEETKKTSKTWTSSRPKQSAEISLPCFLCSHPYIEPPPLPLSDEACQDRERGREEKQERWSRKVLKI